MVKTGKKRIRIVKKYIYAPAPPTPMTPVTISVSIYIQTMIKNHGNKWKKILKKRYKKWWPLFVKYGSIWKQIIKKKYGKKWEKKSKHYQKIY